MIRLAEPAYNVVSRVLPATWIARLEEAERQDDSDVHREPERTGTTPINNKKYH